MFKRIGIPFLIVLIASALFGLTAIQYYWTRQSYQLEERLFDQTVASVLERTTSAYEKLQTASFISTKADRKKPNVLIRPVLQKNEKGKDEASISLTITNDQEVDSTKAGAQRRVIKKFFLNAKGSSSKAEMIIGQSDGKDSLKTIVINSDEKKGGKIQVVHTYLDSITHIEKSEKRIRDLAIELSQADLGWNEKIDTLLVDSLLKKELQNKDIQLPYLFSIHKENDSIPVSTASYSAPLLPQSVFSKPLLLEVQFPEKSSFLLQKTKGMAIVSILLLLTTISCFAYTLLNFIRQKKLSQLKTEFINNMTHELKTPVATIMLASDALRDEQMAADRSKVLHYAGVIHAENARLSNHIERVLSIAQMERDDVVLKPQEVDLHFLIQQSVDSMQLQLAAKKAAVSLSLEAKNHRIIGDSFHLGNVLFNLIDNANKYGGEQPEISIRTRNEQASLIIDIQDKGIGMSREEQKHIFDSFYRVQSGNVHNVKGFGLGLSYVQRIAQLSNGKVSVASSPGKGTIVQLILPLYYAG